MWRILLRPREYCVWWYVPAATYMRVELTGEMQRFGSDNVFSYVQIRGSSTYYLVFSCPPLRLSKLLYSTVPLFWSQPGLALKPPPKLDRPVQDALPAVRAHLKSCALTCTTPGNDEGTPVVCVNLVEKGAREGVVGGGFGEVMRLLGEEEDELDAKLVE
jgi:hypothetical protein